MNMPHLHQLVDWLQVDQDSLVSNKETRMQVLMYIKMTRHIVFPTVIKAQQVQKYTRRPAKSSRRGTACLQPDASTPLQRYMCIILAHKEKSPAEADLESSKLSLVVIVCCNSDTVTTVLSFQRRWGPTGASPQWPFDQP